MNLDSIVSFGNLTFSFLFKSFIEFIFRKLILKNGKMHLILKKNHCYQRLKLYKIQDYGNFRILFILLCLSHEIWYQN